MNIGIALLVFYIGAIFGNIYFNLKEHLIKKIEEKENDAKKKINKKENTEKHGLLENIPIISYFIFGKKSKEKLFVEVIVGFIFIALYTLSMVASVNDYLLISFPLMLGFIYLLGSIEKEKNIIEPNVITYGIIVAAIQVILRYILNFDGGKYVKYDLIMACVYMLFVLIVFVSQMATASKDPESKYVIDIFLIIFILTIYFGSMFMLQSISVTLVFILFGYLFGSFTKREYKENVIVKKENGKLKTRTESAFVKENKYIPYAKIIGDVTVIYLLLYYAFLPIYKCINI